MKKFLITFCLYCSFFCLFSGAQVLNFCEKGDSASNEILKSLIQQEVDIEDFEVVSYFYDLDKDGRNEILGIVKTNLFYSLAGYKLIALKLDDNGYWNIIESDVYFDETKEFEINNKKIKYFGTVLYKNKKYSAKIKKNKIAARKSPFDRLKDRHASHIEQVTAFSEGREKIKINLESFPASTQRDADFFYRNLSDKTKRYMQ